MENILKLYQIYDNNLNHMPVRRGDERMIQKPGIHLTDDMSLTFYLTTTRNSNRLKKTVWLESIYYDILKENNIVISDLINYILEKYLQEMGYLDVEQYLD